MNKSVPIFLLLAIGCSDERPSTDAADTAPQSDSVTAPVEHAGAEQQGRRPPEARTDTIEIEGMPEETVLRLVESPTGFTPAFYTYVPEDLANEHVSSGEGDAWRFNSRFAGVENPEAFVLVFIYPENTSDATADRMVDALIAGRTDVQRNTGGSRRFEWSEREYSYRGTSESGQRLVGSVALGRHNGRLFHVVVEYPVEYGDGFGPRAHRVLSEWRWADGSSLIPQRD